MALVVVGVDSSDASRRAVEYAAGQAKLRGAEVILAHVVPWSPYSFQTPEENEARHVRRQEELDAARSQILEPLAAVARDNGAEVQLVARHGHPAEELSRIAVETAGTHVVVGRTGESKIRQVLFGSIPGQLVQICPVPVTVVP